MKQAIVLAALTGFLAGTGGAWAWRRFEQWRTVRMLTKTFMKHWESDPEGFVRPIERDR